MRRVKIYGVCLDRVAALISKAKERLNGDAYGDRVLLESYCTGDLDALVYILDLYDLEKRTQTGLTEELDKVAYAISVITSEIVTFGYNRDGHLGLYLTIGTRDLRQEPAAVLA